MASPALISSRRLPGYVKYDSLTTTMSTRRTERGRKRANALRSFTRQELAPLWTLAAVLNGEWPGQQRPAVSSASALDEARAIVEGVQKSPADGEWRRRFDDLANQAPFVWRTTALFLAGNPAPKLDDPRTWNTYVTLSYLRRRDDWRAASGVPFVASPSGLGWLVTPLAAVLNSRHRDRLRSCQQEQCGRWFVDMTRNKSALRCSRTCTIKWSHAQRRKGGRR
jgi:hypothetical protein